MQKATFAAGCFWGVEQIFYETKGVQETRVGYTGGHTENPTYQAVCTGQTGHAEAVEIVFDPQIISYQQLLQVFWKSHNPTSLNRQGPDVGTQYRSAIYFHSQEQQKQAEDSRRSIASDYKDPIVTEVTEAGSFYQAEEYHQKYFQKHPGHCQI